MSKIYARQIAPEYQESPLFLGDEFWPENVAAFGNDRLREHWHGEALEDLPRLLLEALEVWENMQHGCAWYDSWAEALRDLLPPVGRGDYTRAERLQWAELLHDMRDEYDPETLAAAATLRTGEEYDGGTILGCCQSDWQNIVYPAAYGPAWLAVFESEYFNLGEEWLFSEPLEDAPDDPGDVYGCTVYVHSWRDDDKRREIADAAGCDPAELVLYAFDGFTRTAKYREV